MKLRAFTVSALVLLFAALVVPTAGNASDTQPHWTIAPFAGLTKFSDQFGKDALGNTNVKVDDNGNYGARIGYVWGSGVGLEAVGGWTQTKLKDDVANASADMTFYHGSLDLIFEPRVGKFGGPFIAAGGGYVNTSTTNVSPSGSIAFANSDKADELKQGVAEAALGWMFPLGEHMGLRLEARNLLWVPKNDVGSAKLNYQVYGGALEFQLGGKAKDTDADGVPDKKDKCPATPVGAKVDATGCPMDTDGDGVFDGLDKCDNTPAGAKVDKDGCPIEVTEKETELLDTGMIRLNNVNFATGKSELLPEDFATLDVIGQVMLKWPQLQIEIGGHTDNTGSAALNQRLSDARANAVLKYLLDKFPTLGAGQFTAKGYGLSKPLVPNSNSLNRAKNRRVEFTVLNKEVLKKEVERRKLLQK